MQVMSSTDAKQSFGAALDAAQRGPVLIKKQNRDFAILLSVQAYDKLRGLRLKVLDDIADKIAATATARGMTDAKFQELMSDLS